MNFKDALEYLFDDGLRISRESWNYWLTIKVNPITEESQIIKQKDNEDLADNEELWVPTQEDILADDWVIEDSDEVEDEEENEIEAEGV